MEKYLEYLKLPIVLYSAAGIALLLIILILVRMGRAKKLRQVFEDFGYQYNSLKSIPLLFKLNKASALAKVSAEIRELVDQAKIDYDSTQINLRQLNDTLSENEDYLELGKVRKAKKNVDEIESLLSRAKYQIDGLTKRLDEILEQESQLRLRINKLKGIYHDLKLAINSDIDKYAYCIEVVDENMTLVEEEFSKFENSILASKFGEAAEISNGISDKIQKLKDIINRSPILMEQAKTNLPQMLENVSNTYNAALEEGCVFINIPVQTILNDIENALKTASGEIRGGRITEIDSQFSLYNKQLEELAAIIYREHQAVGGIRNLIGVLIENLDKAQNQIDENRELNERITLRYKTANQNNAIKQQLSNLALYRKQLGNLEGEFSKGKTLTSGILLRLKELELSFNQFTNDLLTFNHQLKEVCKDEDDAKEQLLKLRLVINETIAAVNRHHLPSISETYLSDLQAAKDQVDRMEDFLREENLQVERLKIVQTDTKDFVYKFFNNVNTIVGLAETAENTIVFCNKYRSMFPDIDSDISKAEMCFNNGEYSKSLALSLTIAERLYPHNYADLIKEYSKQ